MKVLARYTQVAPYQDGGVVGFGSAQKFLNHDLWVSVVKILHPIKYHGFVSAQKVYDACPFPNNREALEVILSSHMLVDEGSFDEHDRYSRNHLYYQYNGADPAEVQKRLSAAHVTLMGCGGIGTSIAYYLATSGIGHITLVDYDTIELTNLTRQFLFTERDIGKKKTQVLQEALQARNSTVTIDIQELEIKTAADLQALAPSDLLVVSADSPLGVVNWVNAYCVEKKQPYINIGYLNDISVIGPLYIPGKTACLACQPVMPNYQETSEINELCKAINHSFKPASFPSVNGVAASYAFNDIVRFLGQFGTLLSINRRVGIHSSKATFEFQVLGKNPSCPLCSVQAAA